MVEKGRSDYLFEILKAEIKKQMFLRKLEYKDLEKLTGIKSGTISAFMCGARNSETTARALAKVLEIER